MERIVYKIALDVTKAESQKFLTGFSIGENRARVLKITLNNGRNPIHFDGTETISMFVTKPSDSSPSIGLCSLEDDTIIYNVLQSDVSEEGTVKFSLKVEQLEDNLITVLYAAHFGIQVTDPECDDSHAPDDPNFSILEQLIAEVEEFDSDAEAYAIGTRGGEPVEEDDPAYHNNAKYYAENLEVEVEEQVERAEAWATGTKGGVPVSESDPQYHNNAKYYAEQADTSADNAATSESNAAISETNASGYASSASANALKAEGFAVGAQGGTPVTSESEYYHNNSKYYKEQAATSATNAATSESNASGSATSASGSASSASTNALKAEGFAVGEQGGVPVSEGTYYHSNAKYYKEQAATSATNAGTSETNAAASELAASGSASTASNKALDSEAWSIGTRGGVPVAPSDPTYENNAKYWAEQASAGQIQADWNQTDNTQKDFIKNKEIVENAIAVNMIPYPYYTSGYAEAGMHFSVNTDGGIEIYTDVGGTTSTVYVPLMPSQMQKTIPDGDYVISLQNAVSGLMVYVQAHTKTTYEWAKNYGDSDSNNGRFNKSDGDTYYTHIFMRIASGTIIPEANPVTVYPMLETGNVAHPYVPYIAEGSHINEVVKSVKDSIPDAQIQSDWNQADNTKKDYIKNKPTIPSTAADISLVTTGTSLPGTVDDLQKLAEYMFPPGVNVTLTLNGAKNDVITVKDSNNQTVGTCTFAAGQTSGTVQIQVPVGGGNFKFISSVAKVKSGGSFVDYEKTVALSDAVSQTVNVYPKNAFYWYGKDINNITHDGYSWNGATTYAANKDTNYVEFTQSSFQLMGTANAIDFTPFTKLHFIVESDVSINTTGGGLNTTKTSITAGGNLSKYADFPGSNNAKADVELDVSSINQSAYIFMVDGSNTSHSCKVYAIFGDDGHEDDITIHGAKEDILTIKDSDGQIAATCIFGSGKTVGYVSKALLPPGTYKFISSVAKDITTGTDDYEKTITLDGSESEVNVFPTEADGRKYFVWYRNPIIPYTAKKISYWATATLPTVTEENTFIKIYMPTGNTNTGGIFFENVDVVGYSKLMCTGKCEVVNSSSDNNSCPVFVGSFSSSGDTVTMATSDRKETLVNHFNVNRQSYRTTEVCTFDGDTLQNTDFLQDVQSAANGQTSLFIETLWIE